jgi:DNA-binding CsgD family transcriptional regulator
MCREIEFFSLAAGERMYRHNDDVHLFDETKTDIVDYSYQYIGMRYAAAMARLTELFSSAQPNFSFFRFKVVDRFVRCNFSSSDTKLDIDEDGIFNLEYVSCPLRGGVCPDEGIICLPKLTMNIRKSEMLVFSQLKNGLSYDEIGANLHISPITVKHHCEALRKTIGVSTNERLIAFWHKNNMNL